MVGIARSTKRRPSGRGEEAALVVEIHKLSERYPRFGYRKIYDRLKGSRWRAGRERVRLIRHRERLRVPQKARKRRRPETSTIDLEKAKYPNHVWSYDFVMDQTTGGQTVRFLTVIDGYTRRSRAETSNVRWAMDVTHISCGQDGWGHLAAVIGCHDRETVGYEFALRGRVREAERALEEACIHRFGTLHPKGQKLVVRSDNGLIFQGRRFRAACRDYGLAQGFITPYTPEQNGMIERFFRSLKEESGWQHSFASFEEAKAGVARWIRWYNAGRPHQALDYMSPAEYRAQQLNRVA